MIGIRICVAPACYALLGVALGCTSSGKVAGGARHEPAPAPKAAAVHAEEPTVEPSATAGPADAAVQPVEVQEESWPDGRPKLRSEGYRDQAGDFIRHGLTTSWYESGQKRYEGEWRDGVQHGRHQTWYVYGQTFGLGSYDDGLEDGPWMKWHQNGQKHSEWTMRAGAWDGVYTEWHENGKKRMEVEWVAGRRQGPQYFWDEQGVLMQTNDFVDGEEQP